MQGIILQGVSHAYASHGGVRHVLRDADLQVHPGQHIGVLGFNGTGKSSLLRIVAGLEPLQTGFRIADMSVSWPLAFGGAFQGGLTGLDNIRFIARIYGVPLDEALEKTESLAGLGRALQEPVRHYSTGMRARLAFGLSLSVEFDCYLIDEIIAVGDERFRERCLDAIFEQRRDRAWMLVSHDEASIRTYCRSFIVIKDQRLQQFDDADAAYTALRQ